MFTGGTIWMFTHGHMGSESCRSPPVNPKVEVIYADRTTQALAYGDAQLLDEGRSSLLQLPAVEAGTKWVGFFGGTSQLGFSFPLIFL